MYDGVCFMTAPMVPPEVDLRSIPYVPLYWRRLLASRFNRLASPQEKWAGLLLWLKSWDEVPAGSLPNNDRELYLLAELRDNLEWRKVKKWALHGWELCDDGRLYHPIVAEVALETWTRLELNRHRTQAATEARKRHRDVERDVGFPHTPFQEPDTEGKRAHARARASLKNGADKHPSPINPRILGHSQPCHCANCLRWAELKTKRSDTDAR